MAERELRTSLHRSVFAQLVAIMLTMGASVLAMVGGFYFLIVIPGIHTSLNGVVGPHLRVIADTRPDLEAARIIARRLDLEIRFEGAGGAWTTDERIPSAEEVRRMGGGRNAHFFIPQRVYYLAPTAAGQYVFARRLGQDFGRAHDQMLACLLILMVLIFVTAYLVMRRVLRPLRLLGAGVARLGEGQLDVVVPKQSRDEFGELTDAFNAMVRRVRDRAEARDRLLRDVSHELRSPLTRMKVALELLPDEPQRRRMSADVMEMETKVTELLELERLRDGRSLRLERCDLVAMVRDAVERASGQPPGARVGSVPDTAFVEADREGVRAVLQNLVDNALKYSRPDSRAVELSVTAEADTVVLRVADDGPGIPAGEEERIFEPFYRPDPSRSARTGGYGLGLSICKRVVDAHRGAITVERGAGRGATFRVTLPRRAAGEPARR